jgi:hypothetical protein
MRGYKFLIGDYGDVGKNHSPCPQGLRTRDLAPPLQPARLEELTPVEVKVGLNKIVDVAFICTHEKDVFEAVECVKDV